MRYLLRSLILISILFGSFSLFSADIDISDTNTLKEEQAFVPLSHFHSDSSFSDSSQYVPKKRKLKAVLLSILLGHFGVHRIYLGTKPNVPVAYSLTLGGGLGLLPLIDTIMILQSKDLDEFANSDKVIMWSKERSTQP